MQIASVFPSNKYRNVSALFSAMYLIKRTNILWNLPFSLAIMYGSHGNLSSHSKVFFLIT